MNEKKHCACWIAETGGLIEGDWTDEETARADAKLLREKINRVAWAEDSEHSRIDEEDKP